MRSYSADTRNSFVERCLMYPLEDNPFGSLLKGVALADEWERIMRNSTDNQSKCRYDDCRRDWRCDKDNNLENRWGWRREQIHLLFYSINCYYFITVIVLMEPLTASSTMTKCPKLLFANQDYKQAYPSSWRLKDCYLRELAVLEILK